MIREEDRELVIDVAVQMWCARLQYMAEARTANGQPRMGYSPDLELVVGEAAALVARVDSHMPHQRGENTEGARRAMAERRRRAANRDVIVLEYVDG